jgi:hypothetical protein
MTALPTNTTDMGEISLHDFNGAMIYIVGVLIWYAIGFGLILIDDINPQPGRDESHKYVSIYQTVSDLHEQQARNDILVELKDEDRRTKLWQIYYGTNKNHPVTIQKDKEAVKLIIKQLNELNERRHLLRKTLNEINSEPDDDDSDNESCHSFQTIITNNNKSNEQLKSYFQ